MPLKGARIWASRRFSLISALRASAAETDHLLVSHWVRERSYSTLEMAFLSNMRWLRWQSSSAWVCWALSDAI